MTAVGWHDETSGALSVLKASFSNELKPNGFGELDPDVGHSNVGSNILHSRPKSEDYVLIDCYWGFF